MLSPQHLQGVGLVMEGQGGSLSPACVPQAGGLFSPASLVRHHPKSGTPGEQHRSCRDGQPALQYLYNHQGHLSPLVTPGCRNLSPPSPHDNKQRECGEAAALPGPGLCSMGQTAQPALCLLLPGKCYPRIMLRKSQVKLTTPQVTHSQCGTARHSWHEVRHLFAASPAGRGLRVQFGRNCVTFGEVNWKREGWRC